MFRNPRENGGLKPGEAILPSVGRPPSPGARYNKSSHSASKLDEGMKTSSPISQLPVIGRSHPSSKPANLKKYGGKQNKSILNFFGKAEQKGELESPGNVGDLFFQDGNQSLDISPVKPQVVAHTTLVAEDDCKDDVRYNEDITPSKRRKIEDGRPQDSFRTPSPEPTFTGHSIQAASASSDQARECQRNIHPIVKERKSRGGFVDDFSDGEDPNDKADASNSGDAKVPSADSDGYAGPEPPVLDEQEEVGESNIVPLRPPDEGEPTAPIRRSRQASDAQVPGLARESTSFFTREDFEDDENFEDDEFFEGGEEFLERRWMEEQRELEHELDDDSRSEAATEGPETPRLNHIDNEVGNEDRAQIASPCPICGGSMKTLSEAEASSHVNACLDGTAIPLPKQLEPGNVSTIPNRELSASPQLSNPARRFQRAAIARPAQANPFSLANGEFKSKKGTAFTRLMSGHAEDVAWAEAAANEAASRGKPAYQRTCPFYKIMPELYVCVDAFRYGKVEGQNAYFLSHFHSDHYVGLTAQWSHGPIYASKVTCNLMKQQLKVDPKWVHPLEFERRIEIPNTKGVFVTMLPANHCPGSSLYLFEKVIGRNKDGTDKLNRILHCGDFRACPAHVQHPLLKPDVIDAITGQTKQQIIDTCYLDTTYLTPKFSFPSQSDVIDACAQMCVSLSKEIIDSSDSWEKVKLAKAGSAMKKFLEDGKEIIKKEEPDLELEDDVKPKLRGRLLVVIGTYSIGKERICLGIARALQSKIYAPPAKMRICKALEDADLNALLTSDPLEAQVHMQTLMEIRAETLHDYLITFKGHFHRVVGFRPTGWTYRPPTSRFTDNPAVSTVLHSEGWKSRFTMHDLAPQRGSTKESNCFGVPYSEHSSFRELTMFCCALRINRVIPTVNVGSARSRDRMKGWIEKWDAEKRKNGLYRVEVGAEGWGSGDGKLRYGV